MLLSSNIGNDTGYVSPNSPHFLSNDRVGEQKEAEAVTNKIPELGSEAHVSNKVPLQASRDTNNGNKARDKVSELDSRAMEDHCSTYGATTYHEDQDSKQKEAVTDKIPELGSEAHVSNKVPLQASRDTNNGNKSRDKVSELDSRAMEDLCSTDGATIHHEDRVSEQKGAGDVTNKIPELGSAVVSNQVPVPASAGATNNEGPRNESRDTTGELDSREMEDGYSTDGASIHETLLADRVSEQKGAGAVTNKIPEQVPEAHVSNKVPLQASRDTNNGNKARDKVSELDSRAMEDHCSTDGATTHAGMSLSSKASNDALVRPIFEYASSSWDGTSFSSNRYNGRPPDSE
eukprot:XP_011664740.1 PREDICTED: uncharacterized protein LOC105438523 [Strongylocentrotus purpuratus]